MPSPLFVLTPLEIFTGARISTDPSFDYQIATAEDTDAVVACRIENSPVFRLKRLGFLVDGTRHAQLLKVPFEIGSKLAETKEDALRR